MTARVWGAFFDIRTTRQNAYFFIFEGVKRQKRVKKGQKSPKKKFFVYETWGVESIGDMAGIIFDNHSEL